MALGTYQPGNSNHISNWNKIKLIGFIKISLGFHLSVQNVNDKDIYLYTYLSSHIFFQQTDLKKNLIMVIKTIISYVQTELPIKKIWGNKSTTTKLLNFLLQKSSKGIHFFQT